MTKKFTLPSVDKNLIPEKRTLPFNGNAVTERSFSFSFSCFDRSHDLFNLGDNTSDGVVGGEWFLSLLDCLKTVCNMTVQEVKASMHDLHPINWETANANKPDNSDQCEYWQFRINKSKGRVIGILIDSIFYIVWLDPHHNLTDSEGYGGVNKYRAGMSIYEKQKFEIDSLKQKNGQLERDLKAAEELLNNR